MNYPATRAQATRTMQKPGIQFKALTLFLIAVAFPVAAQTSKQDKPGPSTPAAKVVQSSKYDLTPFDLSIKRLSPNYKGHDLIHFYEKLKLVPAKGEFEKTSEFDERKRKWLATPLAGTVSANDFLAIEVVPDLAPDSLKIEYDADTETLAASLEFENHYFDSGNTRWLETFYNSKTVGTRNAITRIGVRFQVRSFIITSVGMAVNEAINPVSARIKLPREQAAAVKASLRAFAIVSLSEPFRVNYRENNTASLDSPREWAKTYLGISVSLKSVLFVNWRTGEILARADAPFEQCQYSIC